MVNNYALHNVETMRFWCQKVLPLVYDDSLSYYETLCKVVTKLNEVINNENGQNDAITALDEQVGALATAQSEQYTELLGRISAEVIRATHAEETLQGAITALNTYVDTQLGLKEDKSNKVTALSSGSTDAQYPSAKCVYDELESVDQALNGKESVSNKVTAVSSGSTNAQYPSAKCVFDELQLKENVANKVTSMSGSSTDTQYPSAKAVWEALQNIQPSSDSDVVFIGTSATFADVIDYLEPSDPDDRKVVVYVDSADLNMIATSWSNTVGGDITFSAVVGNTVYTKVLNESTGWGSLSYSTVATQSDLTTGLAGKLSLSGGTMTGDINLKGHYIKSGQENVFQAGDAANTIIIGNTRLDRNLLIRTKDGQTITHQTDIGAYTMLDTQNTEANPTLAGTEADLTALKVNGTSYKVPSGAAWGSITGSIANQTDLTTALSDCVQKSQGSVNEGKVMTVNASGIVEPANTPTEIFWVTYGTTTYADITAAIAANKLPVIVYSNYTYVHTLSANNRHYFGYCLNAETGSITVTNANVWSSEIVHVQPGSYRVTSISSSSTDAQYPSAKCVYDNLATKVDIAQGVAHAGEFLVVGSDGNVTTVTMAQWTGGSY